MNLGNELRRCRKQRNLTLKAVAEKAGVSEGFLSQVENNVKSPSVETLMSIGQALSVDVGGLLSRLQNQERVFVFRTDEWDEVDMPHTGFVTRRMSPPKDRAVLDSAVLFIEPGKSLPVRKDIKNGQEVLCVLDGQIELHHGDKVFHLKKHDAAHFWAEPKAQAIANTGKELAVVLWVGTM
ncbi:MAG: XRE family transcriptional regulator [Desulfarculus sp.]|nr:XRE family transcriptional regulator [Pseudomonadota bacterium]MBV1714676.1 XRE family transcriptional regulator [Desulfarculus sp.]MBU4573971.1 XRE family transcriptional regulator [Pseudomonadota bacterium]MBU4600012.1 XRE family transcriptional regulator [Pseudomonadota bacterium]MBV1740213.1 XRE family transcriptional regulator [Desulfarculus sp.]